MQISSGIGFYDVKYQNSRPIFTVALNNIFGKMVTLGQSEKMKYYKNFFFKKGNKFFWVGAIFMC